MFICTEIEITPLVPQLPNGRIVFSTFPELYPPLASAPPYLSTISDSLGRTQDPILAALSTPQIFSSSVTAVLRMETTHQESSTDRSSRSESRVQPLPLIREKILMQQQYLEETTLAMMVQ